MRVFSCGCTAVLTDKCWLSPLAVWAVMSCSRPQQAQHRDAEQSLHLPEIHVSPSKGSLEISTKALPADCATKENTDVIQ